MSERRRRQGKSPRQQAIPPPPVASPSDGRTPSWLWGDASLSDLRLLRRAIREGWPVPEERRPAILDDVFALLGSGDPRLSIAVARVFIEADWANMRAEGLELRRQVPGVLRRTAAG